MLAINATFIGQFIVLLVLLWFIYKVVVPMLAGPIEDRQRKIAEGLAAAERGERSLTEARGNADQIIREARERATQIVDQAQHRANEIVEEAKGQANTEGARLVAQAHEQIELDTNRARESLRREVAGIAVGAASKLLGKEIDAGKHAELLSQLATQI
ncbi:MAG: F0F1 ATP synthase subunit B [Proteobacteria bacterium]|nr:F0F1 ATP synthase subunit B [Pseudomonadota bacterium]